MQTESIANHNFSIPRQEDMRRNVVTFINAVLSSNNVSRVLRRYALCLALDAVRPEFPTRSIRDVLTIFTTFNENTELKLQPIDTTQFELLSRRLYTLVVLVIDDKNPFSVLEEKLNEFCRNHKFTVLQQAVLSNNIVIDLLPEPLERLPYARLRTSGKHFPRIIADSDGRLYDPLGVPSLNLKYNFQRNTIVDETHKTEVAVPFIACEEHMDINCIFRENVCLSWLYGQSLSGVSITYETEQLILRSFVKRPIFSEDCEDISRNQFSSSPTIEEPALYTTEFVYGSTRQLPPSLYWHCTSSVVGVIEECKIVYNKITRKAAVHVRKNRTTYNVCSDKL